MAEQERRALGSDRCCWERLESPESRWTTLLQLIENVDLEVEAVDGDVGTLTEELAARKRIPDADR